MRMFGMILLDGFGNRVHELEQRRRRAAFRVVQPLALFAPAVLDRVILRDADNGRFRMFFDPLLHARDRKLQHVGIGQAALDVAAFALAVDEREILWVLLVQVRRNQGIEAVNEGKINSEGAPVLFRQAIMLAVEAMAGGEIRVAHHFPPEVVAVLQRRDSRFRPFGQPYAVKLGHDFDFRREPAHAELFFQKRIDAVQRAARPAAGDDYGIALHAQHKAVRAKSGEIHLRAQPGQMRGVAQLDFTRGRLYCIRHDGEFRAAHLLEVTLQFFRRITFGRDRGRRQHDPVLALAVVGKGDLVGGACRQGQAEETHAQQGRLSVQ